MKTDNVLLLISGGIIIIAIISLFVQVILFGLSIEVSIIPLIIAMIIVGIIFIMLIFETEKQRRLNYKSRKN